MTEVRLYVPVTADDLDALVRDGQLDARGRTAYGVSPTLAAESPRADQEEREYTAFLDAVAASASATGDAGRVAVMAIDLPEPDVTWPEAGHFLHLAGPLTRRDLVAVHVGERPGADADLMWYDATEAALVADMLRQ